MAKLRGRGGPGRGQGRKPKDVENRIRDLSINALKKTFGSEEEAIEHLSKQAQSGGKDGFPYFKLLLEYAYGKPKESVDITSGDEPIQNFNLSNLSDKELGIILKLYGGSDTDTD